MLLIVRFVRDWQSCVLTRSSDVTILSSVSCPQLISIEPLPMLLIQANGNSHVFVGQYRQENLRFIEEAFDPNGYHRTSVHQASERCWRNTIIAAVHCECLVDVDTRGSIDHWDRCGSLAVARSNKCTYNVVGRDVPTIIHTYRCILLQLDQVGCRNPIHSSPESLSKHSRWWSRKRIKDQVFRTDSGNCSHAGTMLLSWRKHWYGTEDILRECRCGKILFFECSLVQRKQSSAQVFLDRYAGIEVWMQVEATFLLRTPLPLQATRVHGSFVLLRKEEKWSNVRAFVSKFSSAQSSQWHSSLDDWSSLEMHCRYETSAGFETECHMRDRTTTLPLPRWAALVVYNDEGLVWERYLKRDSVKEEVKLTNSESGEQEKFVPPLGHLAFSGRESSYDFRALDEVEVRFAVYVVYTRSSLARG
ncbi:hypothetical protein KCU93_g218, partial [Aureobasidium melanogenum]